LNRSPGRGAASFGHAPLLEMLSATIGYSGLGAVGAGPAGFVQGRADSRQGREGVAG